MNPQNLQQADLDGALSLLANEYDGHLASKIYRARNAIIFGYLINFRELKTLDIGCRTALYALKVDPIDYLGIDDTREFVDAARNSIKTEGITFAKVVKRNYDDLNLKSERFPFVVALWDSLAWSAHKYQLQDILDQIDRYIMPGGRFFIMVPGEECRDIMAQRVHEMSGENITGASPTMLKLMFKNGGKWKVLRTWGIDYKAYKLAKYLPPFLLRLYIALETVIFKNSDRFQWHIVEGFKPMTEEEREALDQRNAKRKEPDYNKIRNILKKQSGETIEKKLKEARIRKMPEAPEAPEL